MRVSERESESERATARERERERVVFVCVCVSVCLCGRNVCVYVFYIRIQNSYISVHINFLPSGMCKRTYTYHAI